MKRLPYSSGSEEHPVWSPDGKTIASEALSKGKLYIELINPDGSVLNRLYTSIAWNAFPSWSPDGKKISFFASDDWLNGGFDIFLFDITSRETSQLTDTGDVKSADVSPWSPDGSRLVFATNRADNSDIYTIDIDTGTQI